jgi:hypothetical protein
VRHESSSQTDKDEDIDVIINTPDLGARIRTSPSKKNPREKGDQIKMDTHNKQRLTEDRIITTKQNATQL